MKPNFKDIDIVKDAFGDLHVPETTGEEWLTPELIPVKPIYTKQDLEGLEHLNYVSGIPPSASTQVSLRQLNQTLSIAVILLQVRKVFQ